MNKLLSALLAGAVTLSLSGVAVAGDQNNSGDDSVQKKAQSSASQPDSDQGGRTANQQSQTPSQGTETTANKGGAATGQQDQATNQDAQPSSDQAGMTADKSQAGADVSAKDQEYLAGLKKCESLEGDQKQKCIDAAKKKAGEM